MSRTRNLPLMVILMGIGAATMLIPAIHALSTKNYLVARSTPSALREAIWAPGRTA